MNKEQPIIIKKIIKGGHGHHGGAWKVAYADFVTAMMAFFLPMWLLNATSEEQRRGISNYFGPAGDMVGAGGSGGILGGLSIETEGNFQQTKASSPTTTDSVKNEASASDTDTDDNEGMDAVKGQEGQESPDATVLNQADEASHQAEAAKQFDREAAEAGMEEYEESLFKEAEHLLRQAIQSVPDLKDLAENLIVENTPEGLRIQIVDKNRYSMFPNGSAAMNAKAKALLKQVAKVVEKLPNKISIAGHTDSKPFSNKTGYSNWELSTDRANATRRALLNEGLASNRLVAVVGKADNEPLIVEKPESDQNRRISITLLRTHKLKES